MNRPQALITYDGLPISSGGAHRIRVRDHRSVWNAVSQFLQLFTTYRAADDVHLDLYEGQRVEPHFFATALEQATRQYGMPQRRLTISNVVEEFQNTWVLGTKDISAAIDFLASLAPAAREPRKGYEIKV